MRGDETASNYGNDLDDRMKVLRFSINALLSGMILVAMSQAVAATGDGVRIVYREGLQGLMYAHSASIGSPESTGNLVSFNFEAFGKRFDIALEPNHRLLSTAQRLRVAPGVAVYRGDIAAMPGSWARLVFVDGMPQGMLSDGTEIYAIESTGSAEPYIYRLRDLHIAPGTLTCADMATAGNANELFKSIVSEAAANAAIAAAGPGATSEINVAVIGDFEFTSAQGANASAAMISRMNAVDGIYSSQLAVQITVPQIDTFPANNDPFSDVTVAGDLLDELADYRFATPAQFNNGLSHLFTGRELDTSTVGVAFGSALCLRRFGAGLTQATNGLTIDSLVAAHEIGHNFGAPHDAEMGSACESEPADFLMAPQLNGSDQFSACSITEMQDNIAAASCITPLPSTDVALAATAQPPVALLGNNATLNFEANSAGTGTAANVVVDVTIPPEVTFSSVAADQGSCTTGAGSVSCALGSIAGGSGVTVVVSVTASTVGNANFVGTITADVDENANNNQANVTLTTNPAVDLVATADANATVNTNQSASVQARIENRSTLTANNIVVTITPDAGLRIDSASWPPGTCSIANAVATCQANSLAAQANETLTMQVTGLTEGSQTYAMSVTATEDDRDTSNNDASGQVNVNAPAGDDGGGGAVGWLYLMLSLIVLCARHRDMGLLAVLHTRSTIRKFQ